MCFQWADSTILVTLLVETQSDFIRGVQLRGPLLLYFLGKAGLCQNIPYFRENFIIPGTRSDLMKSYPILGKFNEITPYF